MSEEPAGQPAGEATEEWNAEARQETPTQRMDRNWTDLLQELRVVQTGVQILTGFLLTLPFQERFASVSGAVQVTYLVAVGLSVLATGLLIAPVSMHRWLFRQRAREVTVRISHRLAILGLVALGLAMVCVVVVTYLMVVGPVAGVLAGGATAVLLGGLWAVLPATVRRGREGGGG